MAGYKPKRADKAVVGYVRNHASIHKRPKKCMLCFVWLQTEKLRARGIVQ